jgi:diguanylate cyclase (GGDEF)-like protein
VASYSRITDGAGHDWTLIVAAPHSDFDAGLLANVAHTAAAALVAAALMLLIAAWIKRSLAGDAVQLAEAMQRIGDGDLDSPPGPMRSAELSALRDHLHRLQLRLRTDRVTGLANREAILNRLHDRMRPGRRHNDAPLLALLFVDLDRFKAVNERHGHEAGDFVLQTIGRRLRQTVRDTDLVARWAGDEFVLLLDGVGTAEHAHRARDQVERVLRDPVELGPGRDAVELDGTVGLALSPSQAGEPDQLIRQAEEDMFQRKPSSLSQW